MAELLHDSDGYSECIDDDGKRTPRPRSGRKQMDTSGNFEKPSVWVEMHQEERRMPARVYARWPSMLVLPSATFG